MAFKKTYNPNSEIPEFQQYMSALLAYKRSCSEFARMSIRTKNAPIGSAEHVAFLLARERHSKISKEYYAAKHVWGEKLATKKIREQGLTALEIAEKLDLKIPLSTKAMFDEQRRLNTLLDEKTQKLLSDAAELKEQLADDPAKALSISSAELPFGIKAPTADTSVKTQFLKSKNDPTFGDFEGLE